MFEGLMELPEFLRRKSYDDVWKCIYCGEDYRETMTDGCVFRDFLRIEVSNCHKCGKSLEYLNYRAYGRDFNNLEMYGYSNDKGRYWKRLPLWMIDDGR